MASRAVKPKGGKGKTASKPRSSQRADKGNVIGRKKAAAKKKPTSKKATAKKKPVKNNSDSTKWLKSIDDICAVFGLARRSFLRRKDHPDYPKKTAKGYFVDDVRRFIESASMTNGDQKDLFNKDQEMAAKHRVQRQIQELELQQRRGELIARDEHSRQMAQLAQLLSNGIDDLVARLMTLVRHDPGLMDTIEKTVDELRQDLAEEMEAEAEREESRGE